MWRILPCNTTDAPTQNRYLLSTTGLIRYAHHSRDVHGRQPRQSQGTHIKQHPRILQDTGLPPLHACLAVMQSRIWHKTNHMFL
jgi:hypothetical protein